jgi:O-antigen/teichoic acid export membrane protein
MWPTGRGLRQVMGFGVRYYFGKVGNIVNFQLGTLLLAFSAATTEAEIGFFAFGLTLVEGVLFLPDTLTIVLSPRVFVDPKGRVELVTQCNRIVTVLCGAALVVGALLAPPFFALFVPEYLPAVVLVWILVPGVWSRSASKLFVPYLQSQNRVGIASVAVVAGGVVNLAVLLILLPVIGLPAAALGVVGNHVVVTAVLAVAFHRCSGQGVWASWRPRRSDWGLLWDALARWRSRAAAEGPAKV